MPDIQVMRNFVADLYPGRWRRKVARMTDAQVMAIYFRERSKEPEPEETTEEPDDRIPFKLFRSSACSLPGML